MPSLHIHILWSVVDFFFLLENFPYSLEIKSEDLHSTNELCAPAVAGELEWVIPCRFIMLTMRTDSLFSHVCSPTESFYTDFPISQVRAEYRDW